MTKEEQHIYILTKELNAQIKRNVELITLIRDYAAQFERPELLCPQLVDVLKENKRVS